MEPELESLLTIDSLHAQRGGRACANVTQLAAYVDGGLDAQARKSLESHIADCKSCLEQLSFLLRSDESAAKIEVPAEFVARAKSLVPAKRRFLVAPNWGWATAPLAACLALAGLIVLA